jgi:hypothetical protein
MVSASCFTVVLVLCREACRREYHIVSYLGINILMYLQQIQLTLATAALLNLKRGSRLLNDARRPFLVPQQLPTTPTTAIMLSAPICIHLTWNNIPSIMKSQTMKKTKLPTSPFIQPICLHPPNPSIHLTLSPSPSLTDSTTPRTLSLQPVPLPAPLSTILLRKQSGSAYPTGS